jgi:hypothetical protein
MVEMSFVGFDGARVQDIYPGLWEVMDRPEREVM